MDDGTARTGIMRCANRSGKMPHLEVFFREKGFLDIAEIVCNYLLFFDNT